MNNSQIADIIKVIHVLFIIFILVTPFTDNNKLLEYHYTVIPFLLVRWIFNYDKCNITEIEKKLRGLKEDEGFIHKLLKPIYNLPEKSLTIIIYIVTLLLWLKTLSKLFIKNI